MLSSAGSITYCESGSDAPLLRRRLRVLYQVPPAPPPYSEDCPASVDFLPCRPSHALAFLPSPACASSNTVPHRIPRTNRATPTSTPAVSCLRQTRPAQLVDHSPLGAAAP